MTKQTLRKLSRALLLAGRTLADEARAMPTGGTKTGSTPRKLTITPKRRAQLALQGKYIGFSRNLKAADKKRVREVRAARGVSAAIKLAQRLARRSS